VAEGHAATGPARRGTVDVAPTRLVEILSESLTTLVNEADYIKRELNPADAAGPGWATWQTGSRADRLGAARVRARRGR